jgi:hypothetical protein
MVARNDTGLLISLQSSSSSSSLAFTQVLPSPQSFSSSPAVAPVLLFRDSRAQQSTLPATMRSRNVTVIIISDIRERYFEFYKRLPQRKTPSVIGGE